MAAGDDRSTDVGDDASSLVSDAEVDIDAHWPGSERHLIGLEVKALVVARLIVRGTTMTKKTRAARVLGMCIRGALDRNVRLMSHVEWNESSRSHRIFAARRRSGGCDGQTRAQAIGSSRRSVLLGLMLIPVKLKDPLYTYCRQTLFYVAT